ncbi:nitrile hydratase accessory protein [Pseudomonas sp. BIGb0381]|uniref:nitrile hydratase accessory protein n=1 Tax=Pseudomonas sp. BIGb0381 TaxID=2940608 RepID=UPI0021675B6D|nr:nitrile hydratase accessory protein [Pseudomonas sp. BIGb0381]MCS4309765.1 nitrile hydratase accessory protein [Pseudomonas sp. BIGb0381]
MNTSMHHDYKAVGLPLDDEGPVFDKPWQAQAFSLLVHLHQAGVFPWKDWVQVFSEEIKAAPAQPGESVNDAYYRQWITAMERMVTTLGLTGMEDIFQRGEEWRQAYLNTPHGQPVVLLNASCPPAHGHTSEHLPLRKPVAISRASN